MWNGQSSPFCGSDATLNPGSVYSAGLRPKKYSWDVIIVEPLKSIWVVTYLWSHERNPNIKSPFPVRGRMVPFATCSVPYEERSIQVYSKFLSDCSPGIWSSQGTYMYALLLVQTSNFVPHARHRLSVAILFRRSVDVKRYVRNLQLGLMKDRGGALNRDSVPTKQRLGSFSSNYLCHLCLASSG